MQVEDSDFFDHLFVYSWSEERIQNASSPQQKWKSSGSFHFYENNIRENLLVSFIASINAS